MRPVSPSPALEKRASPPQTVQASRPSAAFAEVLTAAVQHSQPAAPPQSRGAGSPGAAVPPATSPDVEHSRARARALPVISQPLRRTIVQPRALLPLPPRAALRPDTGGQQPGDSVPARSRLTIKTYGPMITAVARQFGVDPAISLAVARAESGVSAATDKEVVLNPRAVSPDGTSFGLFQLTHATGQAQLRALAPHQVYNPFNASQNIRLGVSYLKELLQIFSADTLLHRGLSTTAGADAQEVQRLSIAAYNAGPGRVARAQALVRAQGGNPARYHDVAPHLPRETRVYVQRVEQYAAEFRGAHPIAS